MSQPATPAPMPPEPETTRIQRAPSALSNPLATPMPSDAAPNITAEYSANTRPATADGALWFR